MTSYFTCIFFYTHVEILRGCLTFLYVFCYSTVLRKKLENNLREYMYVFSNARVRIEKKISYFSNPLALDSRVMFQLSKHLDNKKSVYIFL